MAPWTTIEDTLVIALFSFAESKPHRIYFVLGDKLIVIRESGDWYYGFEERNPKIKGIFPKNHVKLCKNNHDENLHCRDIHKEIYDTINGWWPFYIKYYKTRNDNFEALRQKIVRLLKLKTKLNSHSQLTSSQVKQIEDVALSEIDNVYDLGLSLNIRDNDGRLLDTTNVSTIELFHQHSEAHKRAKFSRLMEAIETNKNLPLNLSLTFERLNMTVGETIELVFVLYRIDLAKNEFRTISENFIIKLKNFADKEQVENVAGGSQNCSSAIFTDLSISVLDCEKTYLVVYAVNLGLIKKSLKKQLLTAKNARMLVAVGALQLYKHLNDVNGNRFQMIPFNVDLKLLPITNQDLDSGIRNVIDFGDSHDSYNWHISFNLQLVQGEFAQIREEFAHRPLVRKVEFPYIPLPNESRSDLYVNVLSGKFDKGSKLAEKNVEVRAVVCSFDGYEIANMIRTGINTLVDEYTSLIYYHQGEPKWNEWFKVSIPPSEFHLYYIKFTFTHRTTDEAKAKTEKPYGVAFLRLLNGDGTVLQDNEYSLITYKYVQKLNLKNPFDKRERRMIIDKRDRIEQDKFYEKIMPKDSFIVRTHFCSNMLTQNKNLLKLLDSINALYTLRMDKLADMDKILLGFDSIPEEEVLRFWRDIFDVLFLVLANDLELDGLAFKCILRLLEVMCGPKGTLFLPILDDYITNWLSAKKVYKKLINIMVRRIKQSMNPELGKTMDGMLCLSMTHINYIVKFIISSYNLNETEEKIWSCDDFKKRVEELLARIVDCFNKRCINATMTQHQILRHLHQLADDLFPYTDPSRLNGYIINILESKAVDSMDEAKLSCIKNLIGTKFFHESQCRFVFTTVFCSQMKQELDKGQNITESIRIIEKLLNELSKNCDINDDEINVIVMQLLRPVMQCLIREEHGKRSTLNIVVLEIFRLMKHEQYARYQHFNLLDILDFQDFLDEISEMFCDIIEKPVFPDNWTELILHQKSIVANSLKFISAIVMNKFKELNTKSHCKIWERLFETCFKLVNQPKLYLDIYATNKRLKLGTEYENIIRMQVIIICDLWNALGVHKNNFILHFIEPVLSMSMPNDAVTRRKSIEIFSDMVHCIVKDQRSQSSDEYKLIQLAPPTLTVFDFLVDSGKGDCSYKNDFKEIMQEGDVHRNAAERKFVSQINLYLEQLLQYNFYKNQGGKENLMRSIIQLMQLTSEVKHYDLYLRLVYRLYDIQNTYKNYTEAALTLKLHADLLEWNNILASPTLRYRFGPFSPGCFNNCDLKYELYSQMVDLLRKDEQWDLAMKFLEEQVYNGRGSFEFSDKKEIREELHQKITSKLSKKVFYYRVEFCGESFPKFLKGKKFVYKSNEALGNFYEYMTSQHPDSSSDHKSELYMDIKSFEQIDDRNFKGSYRDPTLSNKKDEINSWMIREFVTTFDPFPNKVQWSEVADTKIKNISPIECAIEKMESTNNIFIEVMKNQDTESLIRNLNGVLDAAINGGFSKYQEAFLNAEHEEKYPEDVRRLQELKKQQDLLIKEGLDYHREKGDVAMEGLQLYLEDRFDRLFECTYMADKREQLVKFRAKHQHQVSCEANRNVSEGNSTSSIFRFDRVTSKNSTRSSGEESSSKPRP